MHPAQRLRLRLACAALAVLGTGAAAVPLAALAVPSVSQLSSALGGQRSRAHALAASAQALGQVISRLDGQVALIEGRRAAVEAELSRAQGRLGAVRAAQAIEHARLVRLIARLATARIVLARELVSSYENDPPDIVSVVLAAHGFADLLDRIEFVRIAKQHQNDVIGATGLAKARAEAAGRQLAALELQDRSITDAVAIRARAVAAISQLLQARRGALRDARAARLVALRATRSRAGALQRALNKLKAELTPAAGRAYGSWAIPEAIVTCESGGQNVPPNSAGASGYYQFIPTTWAALGGSTPAAYLAPKSEQDRLAAKLWDGGRGAGNWDCAALVGLI